MEQKSGHGLLDCIGVACLWLISGLLTAESGTRLQLICFITVSSVLCCQGNLLIEDAAHTPEEYCHPSFSVVTHRPDLTLNCLVQLCRLLQPIMPFVTEELWQQLPTNPDMERPESITIARYPAADPFWSSAEVEADMEAVESIVAKICSLQAGTYCDTWHLMCLRLRLWSSAT